MKIDFLALIHFFDMLLKASLFGLPDSRQDFVDVLYVALFFDLRGLEVLNLVVMVDKVFHSCIILLYWLSVTFRSIISEAFKNWHG